MQADADEDNEELSCLQQQLQQEAQSQGLIARIQEHAALTVQQERTVLEVLTLNADSSQAQQPSNSAPSLPATLQRLVEQSCQLQTVALVAHELQGKLQLRKSAAVMTCGNDLDPVASALEHGAAAEQGLRAACSAVVQVTSDALNAAAGRARGGSDHSQDGLQASKAITASLHSALSSLEGISEVGPVNSPWSQQDYSVGLKSARDKVWALLQGALTTAQASSSSSSSSSPSPSVLALLSAAASIVPLCESDCSARSACTALTPPSCFVVPSQL